MQTGRSPQRRGSQSKGKTVDSKGPAPRRKMDPGFRRKGCTHGWGLIYDNRKGLAVKPLHLMPGRLETRQGVVQDLKRGGEFGPDIRGLGRVRTIKHQEKSA